MTPSPGFEFVSFGTLQQLLALQDPPFTDQGESFRQLTYLEEYLRDPQLTCQSIVVEREYIDRDYMEDHAAFYSRSLKQFPNRCTRLHFFQKEPSEIRTSFADAIRVASTDKNAFKESCRRIEDSYLGFAVIRPLAGCPVGRTVLRAYPHRPSVGAFARSFSCTKEYFVHVAGLTFSVRGLPFQQQDKAVAACATTAVWSSLHMVGEHETIATPSPASITTRATKNSLPFGRAMPSEGLSLDQMCQAVHSSGVSPLLMVARDFEATRGLLYSAIRSGLSPILVLRREEDWHAVAVAGMKLSDKPALPYQGIADEATRVAGLYIHDDRIGPYLQASLSKALRTERERSDESFLCLDLRIRRDGKPANENWDATHILLPLHLKIRTSLSRLRQIGVRAANTIAATLRVLEEIKSEHSPIGLDVFVMRADRYRESLLQEPNAQIDDARFLEFAGKLLLPRYVGVVRMTAKSPDVNCEVDLLIDMTGTDRNPHPVAVLQRRGSSETEFLTDFLAEECECPAFYVTEQAEA